MNLLDILKPVHVLAGGLSLLSGIWAMASKKGGKNHRISGKIFFLSMSVTCLLGLNAGIWKPAYLLFVPIALISFYQVATGYRILYLKNLHRGQKPEWVDWLLTIGMLVITFAFILWGVLSLQNDAFLAIVLFAFSTIGGYCSFVDLYHYLKKPTDDRYWLFIHIFRMSHGYIAALTAFLVNNSKLFPFFPQVLWLILPISIGQPVITFVIWNYKRKRNKTELILERAKI